MNSPPDRELESALIHAALAAVDPYRIVADRLNLNQYLLTIDRPLRVIALGKAAVPMAAGAVHVLGDRIEGGIVVSKPELLTDRSFPSHWQILPSAHPRPDDRSLQAGAAVGEFLEHSPPDAVILALISGGASAMLMAPPATLDLERLNLARREWIDRGFPTATIDRLLTLLMPLQTGIKLGDIQAINDYLLESGLDIIQINSVRPLIDRLKSGGLVELVPNHQVIGLILSDVVGDPIASIASGLTHHPRADNYIIGNNLQACTGIKNLALDRGYHAEIVTTTMVGEARTRGREIAQSIAQMTPQSMLIYGGETTVTLDGNAIGTGGRNQELALAAAIELDRSSMEGIVITLATDGNDGPTDAAGAIVDGQTISHGLSLNLDPHFYLDRHDSYHFLEPLNALIKLGTTGTNVADIAIVLRH
jgi:glycerate 2-kinase